MASFFRQLAYVVAFVLTGFYVYAMLHGPNGWPSMMDKRQQLMQVEQENERLSKQIEEERKQIRELNETDEARDRVVRDKTFKQKPSEKTIYLSAPNPAPGR